MIGDSPRESAKSAVTGFIEGVFQEQRASFNNRLTVEMDFRKFLQDALNRFLSGSSAPSQPHLAPATRKHSWKQTTRCNQVAVTF